MRTTRRSFLQRVAATTALAWTARSAAEPEGIKKAQNKGASLSDLGGLDLEVRDVELPGDRALGRRMALVVPRVPRVPRVPQMPLLVLLHGLGETGDQRLGAFAWLERYGLASAYARLLHPPVLRTLKRADFTDEHLARVNAELSQEPFAGFVMACPYTPNVNKMPAPSTALDGYADWLTSVVVPRARAEAGVAEMSSMVALDGCSMGGFVGLEVFLRKPDHFGALGTVQAAIGAYRAPSYADRLAKAIAKVGPRPLHFETSSLDPFREANEALSRELGAKKVPHELLVLPGPHDQPFLREVGTLEMLRFHDRRFRSAQKP